MIHFGDCRDIMRKMIADGVKVQTCVTSPPYWGLRDYGVDGQIGLEASPQEYVDAMVCVFRLVRDLLADDGTLWLNLGDSYAGSGRGGNPTRESSTLQGSNVSQEQSMIKRLGSTLPAGFRETARQAGQIGRAWVPPPTGLKQKDLCGIPWRVAFALQADGWYLRQDIIWHKPNPMPESVRDRCTKAHEYLFLLSKSERYYFDAKSISEECTQDEQRPTFRGGAYVNNSTFDNSSGGKSTISGNVKRQRKPAGWDTGAGAHGSYHREGRAPEIEYTEMTNDRRNKRSVWTVATQPFSGAHFATFPPALIEPCILAGSRPGDIVLDPFIGSGTTAAVAEKLGRRYIGIELNRAYEPLQRARLRQQSMIFEEQA